MEGLTKFPKILADERRLFNAFYNLVNNAIPEVPRGGNVTILGEAAADQALSLWPLLIPVGVCRKTFAIAFFSSSAISQKTWRHWSRHKNR